MHMLVTPMRCRGIALTVQERGRYKAIRGNVMVSPENSADLGRCANVARVQLGMPLDPEPLPQLLDATLALSLIHISEPTRPY